MILNFNGVLEESIAVVSPMAEVSFPISKSTSSILSTSYFTILPSLNFTRMKSVANVSRHKMNITDKVNSFFIVLKFNGLY